MLNKNIQLTQLVKLIGMFFIMTLQSTVLLGQSTVEVNRDSLTKALIYSSQAFDHLEVQDAEIKNLKVQIVQYDVVLRSIEEQVTYLKESQKELVVLAEEMDKKNVQLQGKKFWRDVGNWAKGALLGGIIVLTIQSL
jgi:hypothetical protein